MSIARQDSWVRRFTVTEPFKHHKGFTLYKIVSLVHPKKYPEAATKVVTWKRYNDFKKLHKELKTRHRKLHLEDEFPSFVKAKFFRRFEADVVEERRQAAFTLLEFVAKHPPLFTSDVLIIFFETGYIVDSATGTVSSSAVKLSASPFSPFQSSRSYPDSCQSLASDDDHTSFTTDTDSISSPIQSLEKDDISVEEDTWTGYQLKTSLSQTTLNSLASVESLFSRRIQSFKNRFIGGSSEADTKQKETDISQYWTEAQAFVTTAEVKEREGDYQSAFDSYKGAIAWLLQGVQNDTDKDRQKLVKERTADYLCKAEFIANHFLSCEKNSSNKNENGLVPLSQLWQPYSDLDFFKVVGIIDRVMLAIDTRTHYLFIIKSLHKNSLPTRNNPCILPRRVPYMVELNSLFETDTTVFLVLQYISGGKLWDYVGPLLNKNKHQETPLRSRRNSYPYTQHHYLEPDNVSIISTSDSCPSMLNLQVRDCEMRSTLSSPGTSYLDLIRDYTTNKQIEDEAVNDPQLPPPDLLVDNACCSEIRSLNNNMSDSLTNQKGSEEENNSRVLTSENLFRDVVTLVNSEFTLNIEESVDIETKDLVEHAQRLLQSVDATLLESQSIVSRVEMNTGSSQTTSRITSPYKQVKNSDEKDARLEAVSREFDRLSIASNHSNKSLDVNRLSAFSSKGSSPMSSVCTDGQPQWCQLDMNGAGIAEDTVRRWAAQLIVALHTLHQTGIICMDLRPDNVLVCGTSIRLTYFCSFPGIEPWLNKQACKQQFTAPELSTIFPFNTAVDWWSLGVLLYQLLTGQSFSLYYPSGIYRHTIVYIPDTISVEARSLLKELLRYDAQERLGSGLLGVEEIKSHPFFEGVQWDQVYDEGLMPI